MSDDTGKKRKRSEGGSSRRPSKKVAIQTPSQPALPTTAKASAVPTSGECPPILATTAGFQLPDNLKFQVHSKPTPKTKRNKHNPPLPSQLKLTASGERLDYTAQEDGLGRDTHIRHYIGVFDPETAKLSFMEAKKMTIRGVVRSQLRPEEDAAQRALSKTNMERRNELGQAFGTKKAKKALAAITENAIAPARTTTDVAAPKLNSSSQAMMESIQEVTANMASKEDLQAAADAAKPVPPGNFEAEEIYDVYPLHLLIGADTLKAIPIKDWQDAAKQGTNSTMTNAFIADRFTRVSNGPDPVDRLRALRYLDFLIKFLKSARPGKERGTKRVAPADKLRELLSPAPEPVLQSIRRKFSSGGEMRKFHVDLVRTYSCALAAVLGNFEFETSKLRHDLNLDEKQFAQYFREIGGKVKTTTGPEKGTRLQMAVLALPLEFPKVRFQRLQLR
ncbi:RNA polymerase I associated factor, A49-like protein [Xylariaceae sp. FL0804]|nr:RNA polymerase I associated factor, A49-like protein [Xylariaceae sp. FL0804]